MQVICLKLSDYQPLTWVVKFAFDCKVFFNSSEMQMLYSFEIKRISYVCFGKDLGKLQ